MTAPTLREGGFYTGSYVVEVKASWTYHGSGVAELERHQPSRGLMGGI